MKKFHDLKKRKPHVDSLAIELFERIIKFYKDKRKIEELKIIIIQKGNSLNKICIIPKTIFKPTKTVFSTKNDPAAVLTITIKKRKFFPPEFFKKDHHLNKILKSFKL